MRAGRLVSGELLVQSLKVNGVVIPLLRKVLSSILLYQHNTMTLQAPTVFLYLLLFGMVPPIGYSEILYMVLILLAVSFNAEEGCVPETSVHE